MQKHFTCIVATRNEENRNHCILFPFFSLQKAFFALCIIMRSYYPSLSFHIIVYVQLTIETKSMYAQTCAAMPPTEHATVLALAENARSNLPSDTVFSPALPLHYPIHAQCRSINVMLIE